MLRKAQKQENGAPQSATCWRHFAPICSRQLPQGIKLCGLGNMSGILSSAMHYDVESLRAATKTVSATLAFPLRTSSLLSSCALFVICIIVWSILQVSGIGSATTPAAPSKGEAPVSASFLPPEGFGPADLPVCKCVGLYADDQSGSACRLGPATRQPELCVVPRSYCAVVGSINVLGAVSQDRDGLSFQSVIRRSANVHGLWNSSTDLAKIEQYAAVLERTLPVATAPACRCWAFGEAMVAPCDQQDFHDSELRSPNVPLTEPLQDYEAFAPTILSMDDQGSAFRGKLPGESVAADKIAELGLVLAGKRPSQQLSHLLASRQIAEGAFRRLAIHGLATDPRFPSVSTIAVAKDVFCHRSCASCLEPGRDRCRSCVNQLPYPYVLAGSHRPPSHSTNGGPTSGSRENRNEALQYYALIAAHRDGSGYCIPLAFGEDTSAEADSWCLATSSSCVANDGGSTWWSGSGFWNSGTHGHCHPTCSVCRADCCKRKVDNCLACKGTRRAFHPIYRDGTGRCVDLVQPDDDQQPVGWGREDLTTGMPVLQEEKNATTATDGEANAFSSLLQSILQAASSSGSDGAGNETSRDTSSAKASRTRNGTSFLPRRSICEALPQRLRDMPIRAWSQLMFIHADNNLEESALLDLDEMLHPWRGEVVRRHARAAYRGRGSPPLPIGGSALPGVGAHEALEDLYLVVLIDRSHQETSTDIGTVHACPQLEYSHLGQGARPVPGTSEVKLSNQMAFELLRIHLQDGRREWLLLRALGEVDMNDPAVLQVTVTRFLDMFPSRHYAVTLWNHGSAWAGFGDDESNPNNQPMSIQDIATGLSIGISRSKLGKVDRSFRLSLLGFDACLMGSYDVLEALAPLTHFFLASEENEPGHGWNYRSMDPTTLSRKPPPLYKTATAFEYGTRFVTSYGLHPPSSNALTLALIEVRAFNKFRQRFEELLESLYSCGGSNITRRVRRALSQTFSIRGCRMLGLCSCYDLSDFLANLLQQFSSDESDAGRISLQSYQQDEETQLELGDRAMRQPGANSRILQHANHHWHSPNALGVARRALTNKVVAARVLFRKMVVAEVGSREPGRYGGLSIYFPDPNMAVNCKTQRSASSWARRYTSTIRTKYSSFVTSVLSNRKGSVCYTPQGSGGGPGADATDSSLQQDVDTPQWFGVLCSRILKPLPHRRPDGAIGISAVVPSSVASALMFRGFAIRESQSYGTEVIVTSTAQATMADAEMKESDAPFVPTSSSEEQQRHPGVVLETREGNRESLAAEDGAASAAALREFTVVQGWWDSQVWTLRQLVRLDDPLKDPRPSAYLHDNLSSPGQTEVETIVVALQDGPAASRAGVRGTTSISFPFLFFKNAVEAECLNDPVLHTEALGKAGGFDSSSSFGSTRLEARPTEHPVSGPGIQTRILYGKDLSETTMRKQTIAGRRHILSTTVLPLGLSSKGFGATEWIGGQSAGKTSNGSFETPTKPQDSTMPAEAITPDISTSDRFGDSHLRHLEAVQSGTASWLLHERLGREPQRNSGKERRCGARAYLLAEWNEQRNIVSDPVLYVVEDEQATEWPRSKGGLLRPIEHGLRRKLLTEQELHGLAQASKQGGKQDKNPATIAEDGRPHGIGPPQQNGLRESGYERIARSTRPTALGDADSRAHVFKEPQSSQRASKTVAAIVLEESLGKATFFWNLESDVSQLILRPRSISEVLRQRRSNGTAEGEDGRRQHIERAVVGFIVQDTSDQRAVVTNAAPVVEQGEAASAHSLWESVGHSLGFFGSPAEEIWAPSASSSPSACHHRWLGDGICDELCDTSAYEFDGGDCPHLNRLAEDLLEQQEPKGACVGNRCSETALCETYEDMQEEGSGSQSRRNTEKAPEAPNSFLEPASQDSPLVATIWQGPRGRYVCRCPKGYTGDGVTCEDVNECEVFTGSICHKNAVCINTKGSYRCLCKPGYAGDGRDVCMPSNPKPSHDRLCVDSNNRPLCPPSVHCLEDGSCGCREGFFMENGACTDIDECASGLASCAPPSLATCVNTQGGYLCSCVDGYEGDGRQCVASPSTADAHISIAMDYAKTLAAAGGIEMLKEVFIDAILQAIPGLEDRSRIEVTSIYEGSINALIRIHPPSVDMSGYLEGTDIPRQLTAAEVLLGLQEQLLEPLSPLRTGPFGEYAAYATIERYIFLDRTAANGTFDLLAFLTDWLPAWLKDTVPRELLASIELLVLLICTAILAICSIRAIKRCAKRKADTGATRQHAELLQGPWGSARPPQGPRISPAATKRQQRQQLQRVQKQHMPTLPSHLGSRRFEHQRAAYHQEGSKTDHETSRPQEWEDASQFPLSAPAKATSDPIGETQHVWLESPGVGMQGSLAGSALEWEASLAEGKDSSLAQEATLSHSPGGQEQSATGRARCSSPHRAHQGTTGQRTKVADRKYHGISPP